MQHCLNTTTYIFSVANRSLVPSHQDKTEVYICLYRQLLYLYCGSSLIYQSLMYTCTHNYMIDEEKRSAMTVLIQNYNNIRTHLDNSTMRGELVQRRALTPDQAKDLLDCTASVANEKLFWFVVNGGVSGFEQFMQALAKTSEDHQGHRQILNDLRLDLKQVQSHSRSATHILRSLHPRNTTCSDSGAEH